MQITDSSQMERLALEHQALIDELGILKNPTPLHKTLYLLLEKIASILPQTDFAAVMLWDQSSGLFRPWASYGCDPAVFKRIGLTAGESITGKVYEQGKPALIDSAEEAQQVMQNMRPGNRALFEQALSHELKPACIIAAPIAIVEQKFGVLVCESFNVERLFAGSDLPFLQSSADLMAIAIDRSRLQARADAIRQTRKAEHLRSEMMASLSHELRMPLTTIKGYSTMLLMDEIEWPRDEINEYLQLIDDECESMQTMISSILDSSLIDVNQLPIEPQPLHLPHIAQLVVGEVQRQTSSHRLIVDFPANFPWVNADARWIKQVFRNILDNAVKYSPNGGFIVVRGEVRAENVIVSIADQGIGISPEDLILIFEKFFRVRSAHTTNIPGTGLGLPIARSIVEVHGGKIWMDSKLSQGTIVCFSLPVLNSQATKSASPDGEEGQEEENGIK